MSRWFGKVGYDDTADRGDDVWESNITERAYYGDVLEFSSRWDSKSDKVNDDLRIGNSISIIADAYAYQSFSQIKYVEFMGAKWEVTNVKVQPPRLILSLGGVWNDVEDE